MKGLNLKEMLTGRPSRLRHIRRYPTTRVVHSESVAEHCYYVTLYAWLIGRWLETNGHKVDIAGALSRALWHDIEETVAGDTPREFKHHNAEVLAVLNAISSHAAKLAIKDLYIESPDGNLLYNLAIDYWRCAKDATLEGKIVAIADFLSVLSFLLQEASVGNRTASYQSDALRQYVKLFESEGWEPFKELITDANILLLEAGL